MSLMYSVGFFQYFSILMLKMLQLLKINIHTRLYSKIQKNQHKRLSKNLTKYVQEEMERTNLLQPTYTTCFTNHRIIEWPWLKRTTVIIKFQPPCCMQGRQAICIRVCVCLSVYTLQGFLALFHIQLSIMKCRAVEAENKGRVGRTYKQAITTGQQHTLVLAIFFTWSE